MEDGDDDTSLTADGQKLKDDQGSSECDTVVTKDECRDLSSGEVHLISSSSPKEDNSYVASTQSDDKEDISDQESENKTVCSDTNPVDSSSEFLDDDNCDEMHNVDGSESSPMPVQSEQLIASEENDRIVSQEFSESYEDQSEQLCSGEEGNAFSSMEETENVHSSVGGQETLEEEEEEEEDHHTSTSSDELSSKLSESYVQDENLKQSEQLNKEYSDEKLKTCVNPNEEHTDENLKHSDHQEYADKNFKKLDDQDYDKKFKNSDHLNKEEDYNNFKTSYHPDELSDENFQKFDHPTEDDGVAESCKQSVQSHEDDNDEDFKTSDQSFEEHNEDSFKKCDSPNDYQDECNSKHEKSFSEPLNNSDLQREICKDECNFQEGRDLIEETSKSISQNESYNDNCKDADGKNFTESCSQSDNYHDEYISPDEKDSVVGDSVSDTPNQTEKHGEISSKNEERSMVGFDETSIQQVVNETRENVMDESEDVDMQMYIKEDHCIMENKRKKSCEENQRIDEIDDGRSTLDQNTLRNGAKSIGSDSDAIELLESEKMTESAQWDEMSSKQEERRAIPSLDCKEGDLTCASALNPIEISAETKESEQIIGMDEEEMISEIMEQDFEMHKGPCDRSDSDNRSVCEKISSTLPCAREHSPMELEEHDENMNDDNSVCLNEPKNSVKIDETENIVKVNGEVELTNNLLNEKESVSATEKIGLKRKLQTSPTQGLPCDVSPPESVKGNIHFKGFKKRYIAQVSEVSSKDSPVLPSIQEELRVKTKRSAKKLIMDTPQVLVSHQPLPDGTQSNTPLTEYAQYLGLQPTVKFKCYNCGESGFPSMLKLQEHQNVCLKNVRLNTYTKPPPSQFVEPAPSTNFRITRKVYLCSACGTYYENWNLFLHMKEVHKRHICLFCLLMFSQADKLAQHLLAKHGIAESLYGSPEQFLNEFKNSFFVMCCTCEQMFCERDNFFDHMCKDNSVVNADQACSLCGLKGAHFPTCRRAFTDSGSLSSPSQSNSQTATVNASTDSPQNSQLSVQEKPSASKYSAHTDKLTTGRKSLHKLPEQNDRPDKSHNIGDLDEDYDISDAASYCHVNIHEPDKQKSGSPDGKINNKDETNDETNIHSEKMDNKENNDENHSTSFVIEETAKEDDAFQLKEGARSETDDLATQSETQMDIERLSPQLNEVTEDENRKMEVDEKPETLPPFSSNTDEPKLTDVHVASPSLNETKSPPKECGDSESDTSASGESRDSDGSSSSSEASSDENEPEEKEHQKSVKSEDSDVDKSDSDKMSIVVDEARSEDDTEKQVNENDDLNISNITENETNQINEHKNDSHEESDVMMVDRAANNSDLGEELQDNIQIAGDDVPLLELTLEETLEALSIQTVIKECVKISCSTCVYCNHAKKIAVNGKQLVLHLLAEHRFEPVVCSDSGELTPIFGFVDNLKSKLFELQDMYFNTDTYDSADKSFTRPYDRTYECFHCHFITTLHKELYVHNRKMHQKTILLCIMCKSNFYSYSELLCHLCPGIYVPDSNILFRCCLCVVDGLPSAFRLMVHLRKRHHACDVCLETTGDQQKLSNHVWKHKLHHLCYRCGIAYRNKPDITKHLFWKHGTESVLCKKCLQKKWPHVYHFCIPPTAFLCEECNASFSRAVALKVHKRLHAGDISYQCDECEEKFISKKLLKRHKEKHKQVTEEKEDYKNDVKVEENEMHDLERENLKSHTAFTRNDDVDKDVKEEYSECAVEKSAVAADISGCSEVPEEISKEPNEVNSDKLPEETKSNKKSKVVDVYDLPPLNLSSESDDSDDEQPNKQPPKNIESEDTSKMVLDENPGETLKSQEGEPTTEEELQPVQIVDGVWDNFKTYKANLEKREILQAQVSGSLVASSSSSQVDSSAENHAIVDVVMADHDYCVLPEKSTEEKNTHLNVDSAQIQLSHNTVGLETETAENLDDKGSGFGADHNYCFNTSPQPEDKKDLSSPLQQIPSVPSVQSPSLPLPHPSVSTPPPPTPSISLTSSPKKKQKTPKKKQKQSGSSSSSDSSSNSESSSCTCGTNCSCSSTSSSSSGSSSTSSDSDSSSSEGRRRQVMRRERRRERAKRKLETGSRGGTPPPPVGLPTSMTEAGSMAALEATPTPAQIDSSGAGSLQVDDTPVMAAPEPEENEFLIRESDLDTTETETDEDFYDKYPQKQANKLLAEKRNQLLLLAAVAPVNNGTIAQPSPPPPPEAQEPIQKKKGKTKRHKKTQHNSSEKKVQSKLKLNIPVAYYNSPSFSVANATHPVSPVTNSQNPSSSHVSRLPHDTFSPANPEASSTPTAYHSTGSGSETESKRLSKRKRIPKKFYGDSSDEEAENTPHLPYKWRKVTPASSSTPQVQPTIASGFGYRGVSVNIPPPEPIHVQPLPTPEKSDEEDGDESDSGHEAKRSSSESSNSDSDNEQSDADSDVETVTTVTNAVSSVSGNATQQKNENLYCYCQCPYDEVSEMIACDGKDCSIEWFHFECVGIMVPPKGKWFCPDCRKKTAARSEYLLHA